MSKYPTASARVAIMQKANPFSLSQSLSLAVEPATIAICDEIEKPEGCIVEQIGCKCMVALLSLSTTALLRWLPLSVAESCFRSHSRLPFSFLSSSSFVLRRVRPLLRRSVPA